MHPQPAQGTTTMSNERDELAEIIYRLTVDDVFFDHQELADAIIEAGYRKAAA
jgi:hypothetical protein